MSAERTASPSANPRENTRDSQIPAVPALSAAPLLLWLGLQLCVMFLAALRIPLAARYPAPAEQLAPQLLFSTQVVVAGLLFPFLLRDLRCTIQILATGWPFQLAAVYLSGGSAGEMNWATAFVGTWLITLAIWACLLRSTRTRMPGVCLANCLILGGGLLRYLRLEFAPETRLSNPFETALPLPATLAALEGSSIWPGWLLVLALACLGLLLLGLRRFRCPKALVFAAHS